MTRAVERKGRIRLMGTEGAKCCLALGNKNACITIKKSSEKGHSPFRFFVFLFFRIFSRDHLVSDNNIK